MSILADKYPTLLDLIRRMEPNGAIANVVESLTQDNNLLQFLTFQEGNLITGHRFTSRTGLPSIGWRRLNEGIEIGKSKTDQIDETCGMLSARSAIDVKLCELNGNGPAFRASEDIAFLQSLNNEVERSLFYATTKTAPEKFNGLAPRLDATTGNPAATQIIKHTTSPSGQDQTSIWLLVSGPDTIFGIFPKGTKAGIEQIDCGIQMVDDGTGKTYRAYMTEWNWNLGLVVKDYRYVVRICNIDVSSLDPTKDDIVPAMIMALGKVQSLTKGRAAFFCNRTIETMLRLQARNAVKNSSLTVDSIEGKPILSCDGVPIIRSDAILNTEAIVS